MKKVDRKTARDAYVAGKTITVFEDGVEEKEAGIIIEFSCNRPIKDESKIRRFNRIVKVFKDEEGEPSFWMEEDDMETSVKKVSFSEFCDEFNKANEERRKMYGVIVYSSSNWDTDYSLESRSYATYSDQWGWDYSKMGHSRVGVSLDGTDCCRLDYYEWKIDYCYFITEEEFNEVNDKYWNERRG